MTKPSNVCAGRRNRAVRMRCGFSLSHMNARSAIARVERDELIEELVKIYIKSIEQ